MKYLLKLTEHDNEFYVEHTKLLEYGIMTSNQSSDALRKFQKLRLLIDVEYRLRDVSEPVIQGGFSVSKVYYLTPDGFKKCLMTSTQSSHVLEKFQKLGLLIDVDYLLTDVREQVIQGVFSVSKVYYLTPDGFKKCLMRAQRRKDLPPWRQGVDPTTESLPEITNEAYRNINCGAVFLL